MSDPEISCPDVRIGKGFSSGSDVEIKAQQIVVGNNVHIGCEDDESFRNPGGIRMDVRSLQLGDGVTIGRSVLVKGGDIIIERDVTIRERSTINVSGKLVLGRKSYLNPYCRLFGRDIRIGTNFRMLTSSLIGGGSCFEIHSRLRVGRNCHLGEFAQINTAKPVTIGDEVGIGIRSAIFTHGAYQSFLKGYPVMFGPVVIQDNCWLPHAYVLPNVVIGRGTVVAAGSVVNRSLPPYCLAGGVPAKVIRENIYATEPDSRTKTILFERFFQHLSEILVDDSGAGKDSKNPLECTLGNGRRIMFKEILDDKELRRIETRDGDVVMVLQSSCSQSELVERLGITLIETNKLEVQGVRDSLVVRILNQFRRYGVRFPQNHYVD